MKGERQILYYRNYFIDFFWSLDSGARKKISYVLDMLKTQERLNTNFIKAIRNGLFELRQVITAIFIGPSLSLMKETL